MNNEVTTIENYVCKPNYKGGITNQNNYVRLLYTPCKGAKSE